MKKRLAAIFLTSLTLACGGSSREMPDAEAGPEEAEPKEATYSDDAALSEGMTEFMETLQDLLPYLADAESFRDESNRDDITDLLKDFSNRVEHTTPAMLQWPHYKTTLSALKELVDESSEAFAERKRERARVGVQWAVGMCVSCHARHGNQKIKVDIDTKDLAERTKDSFELSRLLVAFQQKSEAEEQLNSLIASYPNEHLEDDRLDNALELYATLLVQSHEGPDEALTRIVPLSRQKSLPKEVRKYLKVWVNDLTTWSNDSNPTPERPKSRIKKAKKVLGRMAERLPPPNDRRKYVAFLRAANILHPVLDTDQNTGDKLQAEAEMMLGVCYASLDRSLFFGLDTMYFKACMERAGESKRAKKCDNLLGRALARRHGADDDAMMPDEAAEDLERFRTRLKKRKRRR